MIKICLICNKEYKVKPYMAEKAKYCGCKCYGISKKGRETWIKGKKHTEETLKKLREAKIRNPSRHWLGKQFSLESREKMSLAHIGHKAPKTAFKKGNKPWNYKGKNSLSELQVLRSTREYREWRKLVLERDKYSCVICGEKERIETDHIKAFSKFPESRFDVNNGRTLCRNCHKLTENYGSRVNYI